MNRLLPLVATLVSLMGWCLPRSAAATSADSVVFSSLPAQLAPDYFSEGFESGHITEIGDRLTLSGTNRRLSSITVVLSSWAKSEDFGHATNYDHNLILRIYQAGAFSYPGPLLAELNLVTAIPYRPIGWQSNGIAFKATFDFSPQGIELPESIVYTISANTSHQGTAPTGANGNQNYDQLGFAYSIDPTSCGGTTVGSNCPGDIFDRRDSRAYYWDGGLPDHFLRRDAAAALLSVPYSPMVQVSARPEPKPSTLHVTGATNFTYNGLAQGPSTFSVNGSSGAVSFVYAGTGSPSYGPSAMAPVDAGTYSATARVEADTDFQAATSDPFPFAIQPAPLTIQAPNLSKPYGTSITLGPGQTNFKAIGLASGQTVGTITLTADGGTEAGAVQGIYVLTPSAATGGNFRPADYLINYSTGTLTVGDHFSTIVITGPNSYPYTGRPLGPTNFVATGSSGEVTIRYSSRIGTSYPTNTIPPTRAGSYHAVATIAPDSQFTGATSHPFPFSITPAPLTITAPDTSKVYGDTIPTGSGQKHFTASGLQNHETVGSVTLTSEGAPSLAEAGTYPIVPSDGADGTFTPSDYSIDYVNGTLIVRTAPSSLVITGSSSYVYNGMPQGPSSLQVSGSRAPVNVVYMGSGGLVYGPSSAAPKDAGAYLVTASVGAESDTPGLAWNRRDRVRRWAAVASSSDGSRMVAAESPGFIYSSSDYGVSWTPHDSSRNWQSVASSSDGSQLAAVEKGGSIYISSDFGIHWQPRGLIQSWTSIASSSDGSRLVATTFGGRIYISSDQGMTWTGTSDSGPWRAASSSADGLELAAVQQYGNIYTYMDGGLNWTAREKPRNWSSIAMSADGAKIVATVGGGPIFTSTDKGATWVARQTNQQWTAVGSSSDGSRLLAAVGGGTLFSSTNSGMTWTMLTVDGNQAWTSVASSADGVRLVAVANGGGVYTSMPRYDGATSAPFPFIIHPAPLVIVAGDIFKPYGTSLPLGSGQTNFMARGLVAGDAIDSVTLTATGGTAATDPKGTYTLIPSAPTGMSFPAADYSLLAYVNGTLTVTDAGCTNGCPPPALAVSRGTTNSLVLISWSADATWILQSNPVVNGSVWSNWTGNIVTIGLNRSAIVDPDQQPGPTFFRLSHP